MQEFTDEEMDILTNCLPFRISFPRGQRPLTPNDDLAAEGEFENVQKRVRMPLPDVQVPDVEVLDVHVPDVQVPHDFSLHQLMDSLLDVHVPDVQVLPWVQQGPSWVEQEVQRRLDAFLTTCLPKVEPLDLTQQIRCAVEAYFPQGVPSREHPLNTVTKKMLDTSAAVLALIYYRDNTRGALFIHLHPNRSTAGKTEDQIEATVQTEKIRGVVKVGSHFGVDKRTLGRKVKCALGCPSSGSGKNEKFLRHNQHISYAQAQAKLLYFGDQQ